MAHTLDFNQKLWKARMTDFKLLLVEDDEQDSESCTDCVRDFEKDNKCVIDLVKCRSVSEAIEKLDNSFDAAIIDLRLGENGGAGNEVIKRIEDSYFRIPVAILTGTPDATDSEYANVGVFKKGAEGAGYEDLLNHFWKIHNTGLTRIMGGRGIIEETLGKVFLNNLLPQSKKWVVYGEENGPLTEKALLRHTLNHLLQLLDDDDSSYFPEEVYITPPLTNTIRTGSIVKKKDSDSFFTVMNPACDLVIRSNGHRKTDRILVVEIDPHTQLIPGYQTREISNSQKSAFKNNKEDYYHWLPETDSMTGGFMNFRKLLTLSIEEFENDFDSPKSQISPSFVKDIVARFSAYYARQGQPEINRDHIERPV